jgi:two-component system, LuxR family, response regulator FixJ
VDSNGIVYVIDDDSALRDSFSFLLVSSGFSVQSFDSAEAFLAAAPQLTEGCILTDVRMPGLDGIELLHRLRESGNAIPLIVMTGHGDVSLAVKAMKLGATDFLEKPFGGDALIKVVRSAFLTKSRGAATDSLGAELISRLASLSQRESQVLKGLVNGKTNKEIAREFDLSPRTVEVYRAKLMTKMQAGSISELVRFAIKAGVVPS